MKKVLIGLFLSAMILSLFFSGIIDGNLSQVVAQNRLPTKTEVLKLQKEFQQIIKKKSKTNNYFNCAQYPGTSQQKQTRKSFVKAWSKVEPGLAPFLGAWQIDEGVLYVYPSTRRGRVCTYFLGDGNSTVYAGVLHNGVMIIPDDQFHILILSKEGNCLGFTPFKNNKFFVSDDFFTLPKPLDSLTSISNSQLREQFNAAGCTDSLPIASQEQPKNTNSEPSNPNISNSESEGCESQPNFKCENENPVAPLVVTEKPRVNKTCFFGGYCARNIEKTAHSGIDYMANSGTKVRAICDGTVKMARLVKDKVRIWDSFTIIEHRNCGGYKTIYGYYGHTNTTVKEGEEVTKGQEIATVGDWGGNSHLHFGLKLDYINKNWGYFPIDKKTNKDVSDDKIRREELEKLDWINPKTFEERFSWWSN